MRKLLFALLLSAVSLAAETPYLVRDINTTLALDVKSSSPSGFTAYRNRIYFVASLIDASGTELWSTDGTAAGTSIVADILPGSPSSSPAALTVVNDTLLFTARDVNHGIELWKTDGTAAGTAFLADINPGPNSASPLVGPVFKDRLYFVADDGATGRELWTTDGTTAGTRLLKDLEPGTVSSFPRYFAALGNQLYFIAGTGLWKTDGTESGTVRVATVSGRNLTAAGSRIYFEGFTAETGWELWTSDGTNAGTRMVVELAAGNKGAFFTSTAPSSFAVVDNSIGNTVLFVGADDTHGRELWRTDGTAAGTRMVREFKPGAVGAWDQSVWTFAVLGGRIFFAAEDADHGSELWVTDGTEAGTSLFVDIVPGTGSFYPAGLREADGKFFFVTIGDSGPFDFALWVSDGTEGGTHGIRGADGTFVGVSLIGNARTIGGKLYFGGVTHLNATEPWVTDGSDAGTRMIANLAADRAPSSTPRMFAATSGLLFFHATEGTLASSNSAEASLWRSDGTASGTYKLRETGQHPSQLTGAGPYVFFDNEQNRNTLMISDGSVPGTRPATQFLLRFGGETVKKLHPFGNTLFASVNDALWKTTAEPYAAAIRLPASYPGDPVEAAGSYMLFAGTLGRSDGGLWITARPAGRSPSSPTSTSREARSAGS